MNRKAADLWKAVEGVDAPVSGVENVDTSEPCDHFEEVDVRMGVEYVYMPMPVKAQAVLIPADASLRALFRLARRHGMVLKQYREGGLVGFRGPLFWFGQTAEREYTVQVARHSEGWSVEITCSSGQVRLSHATPRTVCVGLAALLGDDWSHQL